MSPLALVPSSEQPPPTPPAAPLRWYQGPTAEVVAKLLTLVESKTCKGAGIVEISRGDSGAMLGTVMGEGGRIRWASCASSPLTLTWLLQVETGLSPREMQSLYRSCQQRGEPIGQRLVGLGLLEASRFREVLRRHSVSGLIALVQRIRSSPNVKLSLSLVGSRDETSEFAFSAVEFFLATMESAEGLVDEQASYPTTFRSLASLTPTALCFRERSVGRFPSVPVACQGIAPDLSLVDVMNLAKSVKTLLRPPVLGVGGIEPSAVLVHRSGRGWLVTSLDGFLCLFGVEQRSHYGYLLSEIRRARSRRRRAPTALDLAYGWRSGVDEPLS